jgi:hypothetical protein
MNKRGFLKTLFGLFFAPKVIEPAQTVPLMKYRYRFGEVTNRICRVGGRTPSE